MNYEKLIRNNIEVMTIEDFDFDYSEMNYYLNHEIELTKDFNRQIEKDLEKLNQKIAENKRVIAELGRKIEQNRNAIDFKRETKIDEELICMVDL